MFGASSPPLSGDAVEVNGEPQDPGMNGARSEKSDDSEVPEDSDQVEKAIGGTVGAIVVVSERASALH